MATTGAIVADSSVVGRIVDKLTQTVPDPNTLAFTLPALSGAFGANMLTMKLPAMGASFVATQGIGAVLAPSLPKLTVNFVGGHFALKASLPVLTASFGGIGGVAPATLNAQLKPLTGAFTGLSSTVGVLAVTLPRLTASFSPLGGGAGTLAVQLRRLSAAFSGSAGVVGSMSVALTPLTMVVAAGSAVSGSMFLRMHPLAARFGAYSILAQLDTLVVATGTMTTVRYANYPFNSMASYAGKYLGAGPTGLYQLDVGDTDTSVPIDASFETGSMDFGSEMIKRLSDIYVGMRSDGVVTFTTYADELPVNSYDIDPQAITTLHSMRTAVGKGARGKYWGFKINNTSGCDFTFDTINLAAVDTARRI